MAQSVARLLDRTDESYTCEKCLSEWANQGRCCVLFDQDEREERCCTFTRVSRHSPDYLDCGVAGEEKMIEPSALRKMKARRIIRWTLNIQIVLYGIIGMYALISPQNVVFNTVIDKDYQEYFGVTTHKDLIQQTSEPVSQETDEWTISNFLKRTFASPDTSDVEKVAMLRQLDANAKRAAQLHPEQIALTTPTQLFGAALVYFALKSMLMRTYAFNLTPSLTSDYLLWFAANLGGMTIAASSRGEGLASTNFVTFMIFKNLAFCVVWLYIRKKLDDIIMLAPQKEREEALGVTAQKEDEGSSGGEMESL